MSSVRPPKGEACGKHGVAGCTDSACVCPECRKGVVLVDKHGRYCSRWGDRPNPCTWERPL